MKRNDITALHGKSIEELQKQLGELEQDIAKNRIEKAAGKLANTSLVNVQQRDIARIKTVLHEKTVAAADSIESTKEAAKASK